MKKKSSPLRIAVTILGSFFLLFLALGLTFTFGIKKSKVSAEAKRLVENLGTEPAMEVLNKLAALTPTGSNVKPEASTEDIVVIVPIGPTSAPDPEVTPTGQEAPSQSETVKPTGSSSESILDMMKKEWNKQLDAETVTNLSQEEQIEVHSLFTNTIFFGDSMAQAIGEYGFMDKANVVYQRSATIDVLIGKVPELAATWPQRVIIFTGLNDCNHYADTTAYKQDYASLIDQIRAAIPGVEIYVTSLLPPSDTLAQTRPDLARAPIFDMELRSVCQSKNVTYIDSTWIVRQNNYLKDGIHMNRTFYRIWFRYLKVLIGNS